jgi:predicted Zn-dependent peptidase
MVTAAIVRERMRRLREALGAAYAIEVAQHDHPGAGGIVITAAVDSTRSGEAMKVMMEEIERLRAGDRDLAEAFVRARRLVVQEIVAESSGADRSAEQIAHLIAGGDDLASTVRLARQVMELTMDDARSALAAELDASRQVTAIVGPPDSVDAARRAVIGGADERASGVSPDTE